MGHRKSPCNPPDRAPEEFQFFTSESVLDLMDKVSSEIKNITEKRRRDRFFFLEQASGAKRESLKNSTLLGKVLSYERCPGLICKIRAVSLPTSRRRRAAGLKPFVLLDFVQYPVSTEQELRDALDQLTPQTAQRLNTPVKKITIEVGFSGSKRRKTLRLANGARISFVKLLRLSDKKRFSQNKHSRPWRRIYVDPKQSLDEIRLHLLLYLQQEQMIDPSPDKNLTDLIAKCFKLKNRYINGRMVESAKSTALLVLSELLKHFTYPEDWRAIWKYVARVNRTHTKPDLLDSKQSKTDAFEDEDERTSEISEGKDSRDPEALLVDPEGAQESQYSESIWNRPVVQNHTIKTDSGEELYTVSGAASLLRARGISVSPDRIHDWINAGIIKCRLVWPSGQPGRRRPRSAMRGIDLDALAALARELKVKEERQNERRIIFENLQDQCRMSKEAIRKYIYRHRKQGKSLLEIAKFPYKYKPR
jgi:hypothetical protein